MTPVSVNIAEALVQRLADLGVEQAFGISGGGIALIYDEIVSGPIELFHVRHENSAAYAASEAYLTTGSPTLVFTTTGPGLFNVLTGMRAARWDGAKVVLISGSTGSPQKGRWATQETSSFTTPMDALYSAGALFDFAVRLEEPAEISEALRRLAIGILRPGGFIAHLGIPMNLLAKSVDLPPYRRPPARRSHPALPEDIEECARLLSQGFVVWAGHGARHAAPLVLDLIEKTGAGIFCSPRGKGIVPETHPQYLGVSGVGGHEEVIEFMLQMRPRWVLVLGTRLSESTSLWDKDLVPSAGFIHVDLDEDVPGAAYPNSETFPIQAEIGRFLEALILAVDRNNPSSMLRLRSLTTYPAPPPPDNTIPISPHTFTKALQEQVINVSDIPILCENGNTMLWCNHELRFEQPGRYRVNPHFASRGQYSAGIIGAALARHGKAIAVVDDESMLMGSEVSTAVQYGAQAIWIVVNDQEYGSQKSYNEALGLSVEHLSFPGVDFVQMAQSMGADGMRAVRVEDLYEALDQALKHEGPFVIDVRMAGQELP